jgi:hypothetical protein
MANICYIAVAIRSGLQQSLFMQYAVMQFADAFYLKTFKGLYISCFVPFVEAYWRQALEHSGYQFRTPVYTLRRIDEASALPIESRAKAILKAVTDDLGARPRQETQAWLDAG